MTRKRGDAFNRNYLLQGSPTTAATYEENFPRDQISSAAVVIGATGLMTSVAIPLQAGTLVTNITFRVGTTAGATTTHTFFALYSPAGALLGQSADVTTGISSNNITASTTWTNALATPYLVPTPGVYYASTGITAGTICTLAGKILPHLDISTGLLTTEKFLSATHDSAVGATAPSTMGSTTKLVGIPYVLIS